MQYQSAGQHVAFLCLAMKKCVCYHRAAVWAKRTKSAAIGTTGWRICSGQVCMQDKPIQKRQLESLENWHLEVPGSIRVSKCSPTLHLKQVKLQHLNFNRFQAAKLKIYHHLSHSLNTTMRAPHGTSSKKMDQTFQEAVPIVLHGLGPFFSAPKEPSTVLPKDIPFRMSCLLLRLLVRHVNHDPPPCHITAEGVGPFPRSGKTYTISLRQWFHGYEIYDGSFGIHGIAVQLESAILRPVCCVSTGLSVCGLRMENWMR